MTDLGNKLLKELKEILLEREMALYEHHVYKPVIGKQTSYRYDKGNTNTNTKDHVHAYAKPKGSGRQLYSVNRDGSGHDGSSGMKIPNKDADFFRDQLGFSIPTNNILESKTLKSLSADEYDLVFIDAED